MQTSMRHRALAPSDRPATAVHRIAPTLTAVCVSVALACSASCAVSGDPSPAVTDSAPTATIRQTDSTGKKLPFTTRFPDRWSANNDGTAYEPCTALSDTELLASGLDPKSVSDAAMANHQTARGCSWRHSGIRLSSIGQITGNKPTFEERMKLRSNFKTWWDLTIGGRLVMVDPDSAASCTVTVKSGRSPVSTIVTRTWNAPPTKELCAIAIDFTRRTIPKMEPSAPS
ncbi:DUF3558 family protein [Gordonia amarae]|nr:DUF3558 family protein [Gordonia amarae]